MRLIGLLGRAAALTAVAGLAPACSGDGETGPGQGKGKLTIEWTIDGSKDPAKCTEFGAVALELIVFDAAGKFVTQAAPRCDAFTATLSLPEGAYDVNATLVGSTDEAASVTMPFAGVSVAHTETRKLTVSFPASTRI